MFGTCAFATGVLAIIYFLLQIVNGSSRLAEYMVLNIDLYLFPTQMAGLFLFSFFSSDSRMADRMVINVVSGKGGTGKTLLTAVLADMLGNRMFPSLSLIWIYS